MVVVEGDTDVPVVQKIFALVGLEITSVLDAAGKQNIDRQLRAWNSAARGSPWFVLRDLDQDATCAGELAEQLLPAASRASGLCLRLAVREMESWLMADAQKLSAFLRVSSTRVPAAPDQLDDPTITLVNIARRSTKPAIRRALVPGPRGGAVGPDYESTVIEFAAKHWRPTVARKRSPSLDRCIRALERFKKLRSGLDD